MAQSIHIRNPRIVEVAQQELDHGAGRNITEAAENLILEAVEQRKIARDRQQTHNQQNPSVVQTPAA